MVFALYAVLGWFQLYPMCLIVMHGNVTAMHSVKVEAVSCTTIIMNDDMRCLLVKHCKCFASLYFFLLQ